MAIHRPTEGRPNWKNLFYLIKSLAKKKKKDQQSKTILQHRTNF